MRIMLKGGPFDNQARSCAANDTLAPHRGYAPDIWEEDLNTTIQGLPYDPDDFWKVGQPDYWAVYRWRKRENSGIHVYAFEYIWDDRDSQYLYACRFEEGPWRHDQKWITDSTPDVFPLNDDERHELGEMSYRYDGVATKEWRIEYDSGFHLYLCHVQAEIIDGPHKGKVFTVQVNSNIRAYPTWAPKWLEQPVPTDKFAWTSFDWVEEKTAGHHLYKHRYGRSAPASYDAPDF